MPGARRSAFVRHLLTEVQLTYNGVSFRCIAKWLSHTRTCTISFAGDLSEDTDVAPWATERPRRLPTLRVTPWGLMLM